MSSTSTEQDLPFEVVLSNGDRAQADSPEAIVLACRTLAADAQTSYYACGYTATFLYEGRVVRAEIPAKSV